MNCLPLGIQGAQGRTVLLGTGDGVGGEYSGGSPGNISGKREDDHYHQKSKVSKKPPQWNIALYSFVSFPKVSECEVPWALQIQRKLKGRKCSFTSETTQAKSHRQRKSGCERCREEDLLREFLSSQNHLDLNGKDQRNFYSSWPLIVITKAGLEIAGRLSRAHSMASSMLATWVLMIPLEVSSYHLYLDIRLAQGHSARKRQN